MLILLLDLLTSKNENYLRTFFGILRTCNIRVDRYGHARISNYR